MSKIKERLSELTNEDFLAAFAAFEIEGKNYPASLYYDISFNGEFYPPKPILALAYKNKFNEEISTTELGQGNGSREFKLIESLGYELVEKKSSIPFRVSLYDVHGPAAVSNYENLISLGNKVFLWDDKRFQKLQIGDFVFWINRKKRQALTTKIVSKEVKPIFENDHCLVSFNGFTGKAQAENELQFPNFFAFEILQVEDLDSNWNYTDPSTFQAQLMSINLMTEGVSQVDIPKKIEKLLDVRSAFNEIGHAKEIVNDAIDYLESKSFLKDTKKLKHSIVVANSSPILFKEISEAVKSILVKELELKSDFVFEKGRSIFKEFVSHKEPKEFYKKILERFVSSKLSFSDFQKSIQAEQKESEFISMIGKTIAYIDFNAANKITLNEYDDKRVLARSGVNQSLWLRGFLKLKIEDNDPEALPKSTSNAFKYLLNPNEELTMLSPDHRMKVSKFILGQNKYDEKTFVADLKSYFNMYPLNVVNEENFTRIISEILYVFPNVFKIWNPDDTVKSENSVYISEFIDCAASNNLIFSSFLTKRYIASLATKPFVIFSGLSGSGKTKLTQTFAKWICENDEQYQIIPVGADWTNREPLLGYPNSLNSNNYVLPDNGSLDLILSAIENAKEKELKNCKPYFLILDEMNLSHVERYFADFLSGMESKEPISLYTGNDRKDDNGRLIPKEIKLPSNLFIVGTVNIDETTYMFSPKVLDRANTIEFRVDKDDLIRFFDSPANDTDCSIDGSGSKHSSELMAFVSSQIEHTNDFQKQLLEFFQTLQPIGSEFGYRTANEMNRLISFLELLGLEKSENALDVAIMQKLLPKLHGSRTKLNKVLPILASFCFKSCSIEQAKTFLDEEKREGKLISESKPLLTLSFAKIARMYRTAQENGFASYAEG